MADSSLRPPDMTGGAGRSILWSFRHLIPAVSAAAVIMAAGDFAGMAAQAHRFLGGAGDGIALCLMLIGVYAWTGLWVVLALGLLLALVTRGRPAETVDGVRSRLAGLFAGSDTRAGSRIVAALVCIAGYFGKWLDNGQKRR